MPLYLVELSFEIEAEDENDAGQFADVLSIEIADRYELEGFRTVDVREIPGAEANESGNL